MIVQNLKKLGCCLILAISIAGLSNLLIINTQEKVNETYSNPGSNLTELLGEPIYKEISRSYSNSIVLDVKESVKTQDSYTATGFLKGVGNVTDIATFVTTYQSDDNITSSSGHGIIMTPDGEIATYTGQDLGLIDINDTQTYMGIQIFQTESDGKLAFLDNLVGLYEYRSTADGKRSDMILELK